MQVATQGRVPDAKTPWRLAMGFAALLAFAAIIGVAASARAQSPPAPTQEQREAEAQAAWDAASKTATRGPSEVKLGDQGAFSVPAGYLFIPKAEGMRLMRAWGNTVNGNTFRGLIAGTRADDQWIAELSFISEGYVKDDEARNWNADDLLTNFKEGTEAANADRRERGFPELEVIGWVEKPSYDAATHRLVWSLSLKRKNSPADAGGTVNYNTYLLGREGYFTLDFITAAARIEAEKPIARDLLAQLSFAQGKRYEDFSTDAGDKVAVYGIAALVGGLAVKKLGLLALAAAFALKFAKVIALGAVGLFAVISRFFRRRPRNVADAGIEKSRPPE